MRRPSRLTLVIAACLSVFCFHHLCRLPPPPVPFVPSSVSWAAHKPFHAVGAVKPRTVGRPRPFPPVQAPPSKFPRRQTRTAETRRRAVRDEFLRGYNSYRRLAWPMDELAPVSGQGKDTFGGWAATLVDSLDTLWIMGLRDEFREAAALVAAMDWGKLGEGVGAVNVFETTIRHLGGLLSAHDLSGEPALLRKAVELGDMLLVAFDTPNRIPGFWLNFEDAAKGRQVAGTNDPSASPASLCLEFTRLSQLTGDDRYFDAADRVTTFLEGVQNTTLLPGMWPLTLNFQKEEADGYVFSLGALADSLYEYLPKMAVLLGGLDARFEGMYRTAAETVTKNLLFRPMIDDPAAAADILFVGDVRVTPGLELSTESQHLTCFAGGMYALAGRLFNSPEDVKIGAKLARGCAWAYASFPTGIMPEIFSLIPCPYVATPCAFDEERWKREGDLRLTKGFRHARDPRYLLRPEAIESVFVLWRVTGDEEWREVAWDMYRAVVDVTRTEFGNAAVEDVRDVKTKKIDSMEVSRGDVIILLRRWSANRKQSFWLAETLKYFYLIFSPPDLISLDDYVLNTEAHPFRRPKP